MQVEEFSIRRRRINLEITCVDHSSGRSFDRQRERVHNRMGDVEELHAKTGGGNLVLVFDDSKLRLVQHPVLFQLVPHEGHREAGTVYGNIQVRKNER